MYVLFTKAIEMKLSVQEASKWVSFHLKVFFLFWLLSLFIAKTVAKKVSILSLGLAIPIPSIVV